MNKATANGERSSYTRCLIETSVTNNLPKIVQLQLEEGEEVAVGVGYEWIPPKCPTCFTFGHVPNHCPAKPVWKQEE